ncbi:FadR/GntR family transcriptional regulator [Amycolatopsis samaneae]|uniref:FadR/GntR family transcriptional regulator n=1 Tax=Amycolatopsis samaneae TaxID=664691 RepID=A0ABW5GW37_9PSEU
MAGLTHGPVVPQVERLLREMLREQRWGAGGRLPNEVRLAAELGVGRSSVREAIRLLAHDGWVEVRHGAGTFAAREIPVDVGRMLRRAELLELHEVRRALEVEAARLAARRIRREDVAGLAARLAGRQEHLGGGPAAFVDADLEFHRRVVELSGNAVLLGLFDSVRPRLREALIDMVAHEAGLPDQSCAHAELLTALEHRDPEAAIAATVSNVDSIMNFLRSQQGDDQ